MKRMMHPRTARTASAILLLCCCSIRSPTQVQGRAQPQPRRTRRLRQQRPRRLLQQDETISWTPPTTSATPEKEELPTISAQQFDDESEEYQPPIISNELATNGNSEEEEEEIVTTMEAVASAPLPNVESLSKTDTEPVDADTTVDTDTTTPSPTPSTDAIIRGKVYNDDNKNSQHDVTTELEELPQPGVQVKLFSCTTGSRHGITRTDDSGAYSFRIPSAIIPPPPSQGGDGSKACYYIQYSVPATILPNVLFTTPMNGETDNIYVGRGQVVEGIDAGLGVVTLEPTNEWTTFVPTTFTKSPVTGVPTPAPYAIVPVVTARPVTEAPVLGVVVDLELPNESVVIMEGTSQGGTGEGQGSPPAPSAVETGTLPVPTETVPSPPSQSPMAVIGTTASTPSTPSQEDGLANVNGNDANNVENGSDSNTSGNGSDEDDNPGNSKPNKQDDKPSSNLPVNDDLVKPSENTTDAKLNAAAESGPLSLTSTILVRLSNLQTTMNEDAQEVFETTCGEFLNGQLEIAIPPVYNLDCSVVDQSLTAAGRRLERRSLVVGSSRYLRSRLLDEASLTAEVQVTGVVNKTSSIQEPADVKFQGQLVGTFNVQGYLFAEALKEESVSNSSTFETFEYFAQIPEDGGVKGIAKIEGADAGQEGGETASESESVFTKGVIAAMVVGGVIFVVLIALAAKRRRKTSNASTKRSVSKGGSKGSSAKSGSKNSAGGAKKKAGVRNKVARSRKNTKSRASPSLTAAPSSSPQSIASYVAPPPNFARGDSDGVEIGLDPYTTPTPAPSTSSNAKQPPTPNKRQRIKRTVQAPSGKLGIMVANTTQGGPAIHTIRPGSPMESLVNVNDIIVEVNGVDTSRYSAEQITQVMKDTVGEERRITVLSLKAA